MSRRRALAIAVLGGSAVLIAGCTFLISFDDMPVDAVDAGSTTDSSIDTGTIAQDSSATVDTGPAPFPPPCDTNFPIGEVTCTGTRAACAKATTGTYPVGFDRNSDLVTCVAGKVTCVAHCPNGCAIMPGSPFNDQCDDCNGRKDGYYCGKDLRGWIDANDDLAVQCQDGRSVRGAVCGVARCQTPCQRSGGPSPSCCF